MIQLGYLKDICALPFFLFGIFKIYNINLENYVLIKKELINYLIIAFITDFLFSIHPNLHYTNVGWNLYTYFFIFMALLVIVNFIYFNNQLLF